MPSWDSDETLPNTPTPPSSHPALPEEGRFPAGSILANRYRILARVGRGGMGEVYKAVDSTLGQVVALKFLPPDTGSALIERFRAEVRLARQVSHPNVCRVYDIGELEGLTFFSMEFIDGEDLASLLRRIGRLPADKALEVARKICAGLAAAHAKGVLHRDLKPGNVMLDKNGEILLADFGLAAAGPLTGAEARSGTPAYMAPEQLRGREATVASDIYSLGLLLYELFTGKRAYNATTVEELARMQEAAAPASLSSIAKDIDPAVERAIVRCLDPLPERRPASALSVAAMLPGGDPLAAALQAGETPSPELIARSGERGAAPLRQTLPLLAFILLALPAVGWIASRVLTPAFVPDVLSLDESAGRARGYAHRFGYAERPVDQHQYAAMESAAATWARKQKLSLEATRRVLAACPPLVRTYRSSPRPMEANIAGSVSWELPVFELPGMTRMSLYADGRLRLFEGRPPRWEEQPPAEREFHPAAIFHAMGLDAARFQAAEPQWISPQPFDKRLAWTGTDARAPELPLRVEAALWRGAVVYAQAIPPWTEPPQQQERAQTAGAKFSTALLAAVVLGMIGFAIWLAHRNWRNGRGDRRGALRIGCFAFLLEMALWALDTHHVAGMAELGFFFYGIAEGLFGGALFGAFYFALEPWARVRWPHKLITWSRALAGEWRDPQVAAAILMGLAAGLFSELFYLADTALDLQHGVVTGLSSSVAFADAPTFLALLLRGMRDLLNTGLFGFLLLLIARGLLRRDWLALAAVIVLVATPSLLSGDRDTVLGYVLVYAMHGFLFFVLFRFGLLTGGAAFFATTVTSLIRTLDPASTAFAAACWGMGVLGGLALVFFYFSRAGEPLFGRSILDD